MSRAIFQASGAILCLLWLAPSTPAKDWPIPRGPSSEPEPYTFRPAVIQQLPKEFLDDAPACILYTATTFQIDNDGTTTATTHELIRLNSRKAIEKLGEYRSIQFTPSYETATLHGARLHKASGKIQEVEPQHAHLRDTSTDYLVYDSIKELVISFPNLEVGDVMEVKWSIRGRNPEYDGHFFTRYPMGHEEYPVAQDECRVVVPKDRKLAHGVIHAALAPEGKLEPQIGEHQGKRYYRWVMQNLHAFPKEEALPPKEEFRIEIHLSTFQSWEEVRAWKTKIRKDCWECSPELKKIVAEVIRNQATDLEKVKALTYWLRHNIRYISIGEKHDFTPHSPNLVLKNRYGDCKDTSQMLAAMLKEAGIRSYLVTLGTRGDGQIDEKLPSPWGTHAILMVPIAGKNYWIDTTLSLAKWDLLHESDTDRIAYAVSDQEIRLLRTPKLQPEDERLHLVSEVHLDRQGNAKIDREAVYHGTAAWRKREEWADVPSGERRRQVLSELQNVYPKARLNQLQIDESTLKNLDVPVRAKATIELPALLDGDEVKKGSLSESNLYIKLIAFNVDLDRQVPMDIGPPFILTHRYVIHAPTGYRLVQPPEKNVSYPTLFGTLSRSVKTQDEASRKWEVEIKAQVTRSRIETKELLLFQAFQDMATSLYRFSISMQLADGDFDADIQELQQRLARQANVDDLLTLAELYQRQNKATEAQKLLADFCDQAKDPQAIREVFERRTRIEGDRADREKAYRALLNMYPQELHLVIDLAVLLLQQEDKKDAEKLLLRASKSPDAGEKSRALLHLARLRWQQQRPQEAWKLYQQAKQADEASVTNPLGANTRGHILTALGQIQEALEAYDEALIHDEHDTEAMQGIIELSLREGDTPKALQMLRKFSLEALSNVELMAQAAHWYWRLERYDEAFDLASEATQNQAPPLAHRVMGLILLRRGENEEALDYLKRAELDNEVLEGRILASLRMGLFSEVRKQSSLIDRIENPSESLKKLVETANRLAARRESVAERNSAPQGKKVAFLLAVDQSILAEYLDQTQAPAAAIEKALEGAFADGIQLANALSLRARRWADRGRFTKALADAEAALLLDPRDAQALTVRGRIRLERGDKEGIQDLQQAVALSKSNSADALFWYATALAQTGQTAQAKTFAEKALNLRPQDGEIRELVERLRSAR